MIDQLLLASNQIAAGLGYVTFAVLIAVAVGILKGKS